MRRYLPALLAVLTLFCAWFAFSLPQDSTASTVTPKGTLDIEGYVRAIDGDTVEVRPGGVRLGVKLIGISAPQTNTACGRAAIAQLEALVSDGIRLEEDPTIKYDSRGLRTYYGYTLGGRSIAEQLVGLGLVDPTDEGKERDRLAALAAQAHALKKGCTWDAGQLTPSAPPKRSQHEPGPGDPSSPDVDDPPVLPPGFVQVPVVSGLDFPTSFVILPNGRILIAEKHGVVQVYQDGALLTTPMLDISAQVNNYWDRGMMALAVDPDFDTNNYIYVYYTYEHGGSEELTKTNRLARYTVQGNVAITTTEMVILGSVTGTEATPSCNDYPEGSDCLPGDGPSHIGGSIKFAPDGSLFLSTGDASDFASINDNALRVQNLNSLAGKLLRIDRATGQGLSTNPLWDGNPDSVQSKVWSYGLRNPFRFNFRPGTTLPYIGDVGMNYWEELDVGSPGGNFGWPCYEGPGQHQGYSAKQKCQDLYQLGASAVQTPLLSLYHSTGSLCIVGGTFYTGSIYPEQYHGAYFYGDCGTRYIDYVYVDANNRITSGPFRFGYLHYNLDDYAFGGPTQIEMGPDGNLYILETLFGILSRIEVGETQAPPQGSSYVSDLAWTFATSGWGPAERDMSNGDRDASDGVSITLNTVTYPKGIGAHATSDIKVYLGKSCTDFASDIGVDDEAGANGSVVFEVRAEGTLLFASTVMYGSSPTQNVSVDVTGKEELVLSVRDGGDNNHSDHADWADARLTCKGTPSVVSTAPVDGEAGVSLDSNIAAIFNKPMEVSTLTDANVQLTGQGPSVPLSVTLNYSPTTRTLIIDPVNELQANSVYTVVVKGGPGGVKDEDGLGLYEDASWSFTTNSRPSVVIDQPLPDLSVKVGDVITYTGWATDTEDGAIPAGDLSWQVLIHHNCPGEGCHSHQLQASQGPNGSFVVPDHGDNSYYEVILTAVDSDALAGSASVQIHPKLVEVTLASSPAGLQLVYDSYQATTPFTRTTIAGSTHSLWAPSPQGSYTFQMWSPSGAQGHDVQVGVTDTTYTAYFSTPVPTSTSTASATSTPTPTNTSTFTKTNTSTPTVATTFTPAASPTSLACDVQFSDVEVGSTFYSYVHCLACRGVLGGYEDGTYRPDQGITRGQLSKLVSNAAGYSEDVSGQTYTDVPPDNVFYLYIERIASRGIVGGYEDGTFRPGGPATRGQIAKVLSNAAGFSDTPVGQTFSDVGTGDTFYPYVERLATRGIVGGYGDGTFRPGNPATRGHIAKMVANTFFRDCEATAARR